jgi:eukaryotic-like serine/threonine-protein kinase
VLIDAQRKPRVTDFGLAREGEVPAVAPSEVKEGKVAGTVGFLAPEQVRRQRVDARSDQFSFCLSLYLGLYREAAFSKDVDLLTPLPPVRPAPKDSVVPGWLRRVVLKGLSDDPAARYPSMHALIAALEADPARKRRDLLVNAASLSLVAALAAVALLFMQRDTPEQRTQKECLARVDGELESLWSTRRRATIQEQFSRVRADDGIGADTWIRVNARIGPEIEDWKNTSKAACVLRGDAAVRARWMSCLEERRKTFGGMSDLFARADATVVENALNTVIQEVTPASSCKSVEQATVAAVEGSTSADEQMRSGLALARVLRAAGKYPEAIVEALNVINIASDKDARHVEAEAMLLVGELYVQLDAPNAEENLREAIAAAERVGNDELRARAWIALTSWYSTPGRVARGKSVDASWADRQARSILRRLGNPPLLLASQLMGAGALAQATGDSIEAQRTFEKAVDILAALLPDDHPFLLRARSSLGKSLPAARGLPLLRAVLQTREKVFGPNHPETATAHHNLGGKLMNDQDCQTALSHFETALEIKLKQPMADPKRLGREHVSVARAYKCLLQLTETETHLKLGVSLLKDADDEQKDALTLLVEVMTLLERPASEQRAFREKLLGLQQ